MNMNEKFDPDLDTPMPYELRDRTEPSKSSQNEEGKRLTKTKDFVANLIFNLKEGWGVFFSYDPKGGSRGDYDWVEKRSNGMEYYYVAGLGKGEREELETDEEVERRAESIAKNPYLNYYFIQTIENYTKPRPRYDQDDDQQPGDYEINGPDRPEPQFENKKPMNEIKKFKNLVNECIQELKQEKNPRIRLKESLRKVVKNVLTEMASNSTVPEPDKEEIEKRQKQYNKKDNERLDKSNDKLKDELETIIHGINPDWTVFYDDHDQLIVRAQNLLYVRIVQKFENNFDLDAMVKLVDRVRAIALTWDQVKAFVKANFGDLKNKTIPDKLHDKAIKNYEDREVIKKDAGPRWDVIKNRGQKKNGEDAKIKDTKKSDKDYNEPQTKREEDMPDKPMKQVTEPGKDPVGKNHNIQKTPQVKPPKFKKNDEKKSTGKTAKFRLKQTGFDIK